MDFGKDARPENHTFPYSQTSYIPSISRHPDSSILVRSCGDPNPTGSGGPLFGPFLFFGGSLAVHSAVHPPLAHAKSPVA